MRCIDGDALYDCVEARYRLSSGEKHKAERELLDAICEMPTIDAAPVVHARWILIQNGSGVCSACNRNDHIDSLAAYCRYCGAKMDEEGE
jgi:hypothetical protein